MMKNLKKYLILMLIVATLFSCLSMPTFAVSTRRCYTLNTGNTTVYSNTGLSNWYGTIYDSDELTVLYVTGSYSQVTYPITGGTKTGYIATNKILLGTTGNTYVSRGNITTYKRPGGATYGSVAIGDQVTVLGTTGNYTQVKYPVSDGYKYAVIINADAQNYLYSSTGALSSPVPSGAKFSQKTYDNGWYGYHDINRGISLGTPVYAIADGTVYFYQAYTGAYLTSYGNFIEFTSSDGVYEAKYCHLNGFYNVAQRIPSYMTLQQSGSTGRYNLGSRYVHAGEVIGYIGTTGNSSGVHLHFEIRKYGTRVDPTSIFSGLT